MARFARRAKAEFVFFGRVFSYNFFDLSVGTDSISMRETMRHQQMPGKQLKASVESNLDSAHQSCSIFLRVYVIRNVGQKARPLDRSSENHSYADVSTASALLRYCPLCFVITVLL